MSRLPSIGEYYPVLTEGEIAQYEFDQMQYGTGARDVALYLKYCNENISQVRLGQAFGISGERARQILQRIRDKVLVYRSKPTRER